MRGPLMKSTSREKAFEAMREAVRTRVYATINPSEVLRNFKANPDGTRRELRGLVMRVIEERGYLCTTAEREDMVAHVLNEILGFGPIEPLLRDQSVAEVMVNGPKRVYVERGGKIELTTVQFEDDDHVIRVLDKIVAPIGRRVDEACPMVNGRLPDGSRINAVIPPISLNGPVLTVRKFKPTGFDLDEMVAMGCLSPAMMELLRAAVSARLNIVVTGGTGSGKTTLLNALSRLISENERIITIEDAAELHFHQPHVVSLEARSANVEGRGAVTIRDLVVNALRMRPDRIVVGEVRAGECLDMLQAMNTGHSGSLTTAHANSPSDAVTRLETMALMSGLDLPVASIRQQIVSAIDLIVHKARMSDGKRKIVSIAEVLNVTDGEVVIREIFHYRRLKGGRFTHTATGFIPTCADTLAEHGFCVGERLVRNE